MGAHTQHPSQLKSCDASASLVTVQILWFGLGLAFFSDTTETLLHWPHLAVVALTACLMVTSDWFGMKALVGLCALTMPALFSVTYYMLSESVPGGDVLGLWTEMVSTKYVEYMSGFLMIMGSCIRTANISSSTWLSKNSSLAKVLSYFGILGGGALLLFYGVKNAMSENQIDFSSALIEQSSTVMGLCLLGLSARASKDTKLMTMAVPSRGRKVVLSGIILLLGVFAAVLSDWCYYYVAEWLYYVSLFVAPLGLILISRLVFCKKSNFSEP